LKSTETAIGAGGPERRNRISAISAR